MADQGFASMDEQKQQEIAKMGGHASDGNPENLDTKARQEGGENSHSGGDSS